MGWPFILPVYSRSLLSRIGKCYCDFRFSDIFCLATGMELTVPKWAPVLEMFPQEAIYEREGLPQSSGRGRSGCAGLGPSLDLTLAVCKGSGSAEGEEKCYCVPAEGTRHVNERGDPAFEVEETSTGVCGLRPQRNDVGVARAWRQGRRLPRPLNTCL
ncbi:hypothetical protein NDU88_007435 [Pleurodeles waltl]|uniref:Uncharacterized protein n=1 Tax=Pleurodeles waltl TaxID=8319 RepID=A0AAV7PQ71_PLEWA|nr:hypothetical protein NDU88_007435 [Pleurodeles waltl]